MTGEEGLRIGVLGPLSVTRDGTVIKVPPGRLAVLLAVLAMSPGCPVGVSRLADLIWPEKPPEHVRPSLQTLVTRIRGRVPDVIVTAADGYQLDIDPNHVDLSRFRRLGARRTMRQIPGRRLGRWIRRWDCGAVSLSAT